jgi:penicillin-binding protein 2B
MIVVLVVSLSFFILVLRVAWLQIVVADDLMDKAADMWDGKQTLTPTRGTIYDRNGTPLAIDSPAYTVVVNPRAIQEKKAAGLVVDKLAPVLGISKDKLLEYTKKKNKKGEYLARVDVKEEGWKISLDKAEEVKVIIGDLRKALDDRYFIGVEIVEDTRRFYPFERAAAHVIGYASKYNQAIQGIEKVYDQQLRGKEGFVEYKRFAKNRFKNAGKVEYVAAENGNDVHLTLDLKIQLMIERAVDFTYERYKPRSISVIAVNPKTLEILGMSNRPDFNPNEYWKLENVKSAKDPEHLRKFQNLSVGGGYEPGSTFKMLTLAATVDQNIFNPNETYLSGNIKVGGRKIRDHKRDGWGVINYLDGLTRSSNVAFVNLGYLKLGPDRMEDYVYKFGFGKRTNIDLPAEIPGTIELESPSDYAAITYGQGKLLVTPIQQVAAFSSIANGGKLMQPFLMKKIVNRETEQTVKSVKPKMITRTISENAAKKSSVYLENVVTDTKWGTGKKAHIEGYRVAGKTGTANKVIDGRYAPGKWVLSFIGFAPVEDPEVLVAVIVDQPDFSGQYTNSSEVAPPLFREITHDILQYMNIQYEWEKKLDQQKLLAATQVPELVGSSRAVAQDAVKRSKISVTFIGAGNDVIAQYPSPQTKILEGDSVFLLTESADQVALPDLSGYSQRDAYRMCEFLQKTCRMNGNGYVIKQQTVEEEGLPVTILDFEPVSDRLKREVEEKLKTETQ